MKPGFLAAAIVLAGFLVVRRRKIGRVELIAGAVVAVALLVYSTGVVHLPNVEHLIEDIGRTLGKWTYLLVGIMAFLETGAFVGLIAPGETAILVGGVVAGQGEIDIFLLIGIVWACAVAGDTVSFLLGRRLGRGFLERHGPKVKITHERLEQVERFFDRHGGKAVLIGRFVGLIRAVAPFIAGSSRMPLRRFLPYDIIGAGLWSTTFCLLGYVFWRSFDQVANWAGKGAFALGTVIVVVVGGVVSYRWLRQPANRERAVAWLHEQEQRPLVRPVAAVVRPVVERAIVPLAKRLYGPLRFAWNRVTPGELGLELTTLLAVVAVGSFTFIALLVSISPEQPVLGMDRRAATMARDLETGWLTDLAKAVTWLGSFPVVAALVAVTALALVAWRRWESIAVLGAGLWLTFLLVHVTKDGEGRARPTDSLVSTSSDAYPSGHAAYAVTWIAVAVALARGVPRLSGQAALVVVGVAIAAAVGLTRVYLRAHWLSDVLGGWGLALTIFGLLGMIALVVGHLRDNPPRT